jgi:hypothetical protein
VKYRKIGRLSVNLNGLHEDYVHEEGSGSWGNMSIETGMYAGPRGRALPSK